MDLLWRRTDGHPFFVAFAMRDLFTGPGSRLTAEHVEAAWPAIAAHLASERFAVEWQSATPGERDVLKTLAEGRDGAPVTRALGRSGATLLARLLRKGLVVRSGRGEYQIYHALFAGFVRLLGGGG